MNDWEWLQRYVSGRDDAAFAELVRQHAGFVLACARRQVGADLAEDVAQAVFLVLARKARTLRSDVVLSAWLFRTTRFVVAQVRRQEARRQRRETEAAIMAPTELPADPAGGDHPDRRMDEHLDDALAALSEVERQYVLTRFFEGRRFASVGERFGVSEDAAKKRVGRALERMRLFLGGRGVTLSVGAVAAWLAIPRSEAAPEWLITRVLASAARGGGLAGGGQLADWTQHAMSEWSRATLWQVVRTWGAFSLAAALVVASISWWLAGTSSPTAREAGGGDGSNPPTPGRAGMAARVLGQDRRVTANSFLDLAVVDDATGLPLSAALLVEERHRRDGNSALVFDARRVDVDRAGRARIDWGDAPGDWLMLEVSHPGRIPVVLSWRGYEFGQGPLQYECRMRAGHRLVGEVRNEAGEPVGGAEVSVSAYESLPTETRVDSSIRVITRTDETGHFESDQVPTVRQSEMDPRFQRMVSGRSIVVRVSHPDYAVRAHQIDSEAAFRSPQRIILTQGQRLVGRVTDALGSPIAGARVRGADGLISRAVLSQADGTFELPHAAMDGAPFTFSVEAVGYAPYSGEVADFDLKDMGEWFLTSELFDPVRRVTRVLDPADRNAQRFHERRPVPGSIEGSDDRACYVEVALDEKDTMPRKVPPTVGDPATEVKRWVGRVVDGQSGKPVARFSVHRAVDGGRRAFVGEGRDGGFDWETPPENRHVREVSLIVTVDGHASAQAAGRLGDDGILEFEFRLPSSPKLEGWMELANGRPAVGAYIRPAGGLGGLTLDRTGRWVAGRGDAVTGDKGRFEVEWDLRSPALHVVHEEGCGVFPVSLGESTVYRLEPWATVEGEVVRDGQPVPGVSVALNSEAERIGKGAVGFRFRYGTVTDAAGRFVFHRVSPGSHQLAAPAAPAGSGAGDGVSGGTGTAETVATVAVVRGQAPRVRLELR